MEISNEGPIQAFIGVVAPSTSVGKLTQVAK